MTDRLTYPTKSPVTRPVPGPMVIPFHLAPGEAPLTPEPAPEPTPKSSTELSSERTPSVPWLVTRLYLLPPIPPKNPRRSAQAARLGQVD
jgi:hypothetical protein